MWSCSLDLLLPGLWPPHPSPVFVKRTKPSSDTWVKDTWAHVVPFFLSASLFQRVCVRVCGVFLVATWRLFVILPRYCMPLLGAFSWTCTPISSASLEPSAVRMLLLILWLLPTGCCCRERLTSFFFSIIRAVVHGFSSNTRSKLVGLRRIILVFFCLFYATPTSGVVSCTTFNYWGPSWFKVLVFI